MDLTFGGHIDHGIIEQRRVATQPPAILERAFTLDKLSLGRAEGGKMIDV